MTLKNLSLLTDAYKIETANELFAKEQADAIFTMHVEGSFLYEDEDLSKEEITAIVNDKTHIEAIKAILYQNILKAVTLFPDSFKRDADGQLIYDYEMYDYGFAVSDYCTNIYNTSRPKVESYTEILIKKNLRDTIKLSGLNIAVMLENLQGVRVSKKAMRKALNKQGDYLVQIESVMNELIKNLNI